MSKTDMKEYAGADTHLTPADYKSALESQNACNLSGIVNWFAKVMSKIWDESRVRSKGTDWVNQHPICRLMAEQVAHLSGAGTPSGSTGYYDASTYCEERAK